MPVGFSPRIELRSADACCNPYIAFKLILNAGIEGIKSGDCSLLDTTMKGDSAHVGFEPLPLSLEEAAEVAKNSDFVKRSLSQEVRDDIFAQLDSQIKKYNFADNKDAFEEKSYFKYV